MKSAPFSIAPILLLVYIVVALVGAVIASLLLELGFSGWLGFFLTAMLAFPFGGIIRSVMSKMFGSLMGVTGVVPSVGSYALRLGIAAVVAAVSSYLLSLAPDVFPFGALTGALVSFVTAALSSMVFVIMMSRS